jgi:glycosyltransferase involved in cell wall biosynthesis
MRVLLVNDLAPDGGWGTETHVRRLARGLESGGDDVALFAGELSHRGLGKVRDFWDPVARRRLAERAAEFRPDVVHYCNVVRELSVSVLGVPPGVPSVMTVLDQRIVGVGDNGMPAIRGLADRMVKRPFDRAVARRRLDAALAVSAPLADMLRRAGFRGVEHVPVYALDPQVELRPVTDNHDVGYIGRLTADKGIDVLARAFEAVADRLPAARLLVAGEGPERHRLVELRSRLGAGRVQLIGRLEEDEVSALLARVRLVTVPSLPSVRPEGSPLTAAEAALHGRPLVTSDDPGLVEMVGLLGAGAVVPAGDANALADALLRVLTDDELAARWSETSRRSAGARHAPDVVTARVREVHERVVRSATERVAS